ncbi:MAG: class I SAM-dependent methyltransferase [Thermoleophilia bacterium]
MTPDTTPSSAPTGLRPADLCPPEALDGHAAAFERDFARVLARRDEFVHVPCPACGADAPRPAIRKRGFAWVTCPDCDTLYMTPRPSEAVLADHYATSEGYAYWAQHVYPASERVRLERINRPWLTRIAGYCDLFGVPRGTLLEVGAGFGVFAGLAHESGAFERVIAVEPTPTGAAACRDRGVEVVEAGIEDAAELLPQVDVACSFETIEHLFDPGRFVADVARVIRPGGLLVLSCPNSAGFDIRELWERSPYVDPEHINLFTPRSLSGLLERSGFTVESVITPGRLDAEWVREAVLAGEHELGKRSFLRRVLIDEWETMGGPFQRFLAENGLSSHMWIAARRDV